MTGPPGSGPAPQEARGVQPRGSSNNPRWVRIINPVLNQSPVIRRKEGDRLVNQGRAAWVSVDQLRLNLSHEANQRAAVRAARGYESAGIPAHCGDRPNLDELRKSNPARYAAFWRGSARAAAKDARGAIGRTGRDRTLHLVSSTE